MISPLLLLMAATFPEEDELRRRINTGGALTPEARFVTVRDRYVEVGRCTFHLEEGQVLPVRGGKREFSEIVGVVFQGEGTVTVDFGERADAWAFANHMVIRGDADPEAMRPIAEQTAPYTARIERGVLLSMHPDVLDLLIDPSTAEELGSEGARNYDMQMVVEDQRGVAPAFVAAGSTLPNRVATLIAGGLDLRPALAQEMVMKDWGGLPVDERLRFGDVLTTDHYGVARGPIGQVMGPHDRWLSCLQDPGGLFEMGEESVVFAHGRDSDTNYHRVRFTGEGFPEDRRRDPDIPGLVKRDWAPVDATARVEVRPIRMRKFMRAHVRSRITVRAERDGVQVIRLTLPAGEARNNTFELLQVATADGTPVPWAPLNGDQFRNADAQTIAQLPTSSGDGNASTDTSGDPSGEPSVVSGGSGGSGGTVSADGDADNSGLGGLGQQDPNGSQTVEELTPERRYQDFRMIVLLEEPVAAGEEISLYLIWKAEWNFAQIQSSNGVYASGGPTTGFRNVFPDLYPDEGGTRWSHEMTVTMPDIYNHSLVVSGETVRELYDDEAGIVTIKTQDEGALRPGIAIGKWIMYEEAAAFGFPSIRIHLNPVEEYALEEFGPELRRVMGFYNRLMPELVLEEFEIYQGKDMAASSYRNEPGDGLLEVNQTRAVGGPGQDMAVLRKLDPYMEQTMLAREVGRRYWDGHVQPGGKRESWLSTVMPNTYAAFYVRGVHGTQAYYDWMEDIREYLEDPQEIVDRFGVPQGLTPALNLGDTGSIRWEGDQALQYYGLYVMGNMLRYRVGENTYYRGLDRLLSRRAGGYVTADMVQEAIEETSGQDLSDFFDFWVHGGRIPGIQAEVMVEGDRVAGCLTSDVPFGSFDVPVTVLDMDGFRGVSALVDVDNGRGQFEVFARQPEVEVQIDPDGLILLTEREVKVVDSLDHCWVQPPPPPPEPEVEEPEVEEVEETEVQEPEAESAAPASEEAADTP